MHFKNKNSFSFLLASFLEVLSLTVVSCVENPTVELPSSSAYITKVFEYVYAPGQHALLANKKDTVNFKGEPSNDKGWLYLGGFGGYVVAGFDHEVVNGAGFDFEVFGLQGASPEPGVVYVMQDTNGDGLPNDTWYELKGNQSHRQYYFPRNPFAGFI